MGLTIAGLLAVTVVIMFTAAPTSGDRARGLEQQLRCPVCKSVSIAESPSSTATAMRRDVQQQVAAGRSDSEIIDYFQARYGNWVLLDPPMHGTTLLLWLLPLAGACAGAAILITRIRRSRLRSADLTPLQREHVAQAVERARTGLVDEGQL